MSGARTRVPLHAHQSIPEGYEVHELLGKGSNSGGSEMSLQEFHGLSCNKQRLWYEQEVAAALNAVCKLTTVDTIPAVINDVTDKLKHEVRP